MLAIGLALGAACCWGVADFLAGLASRRLPVLVVLLLVEGGGLVVILAIALALGEPLPGERGLVLAGAAGLAGVLALGCFYRALAIGTMSVVAPVGATGVTLPVIVGLATGDRPSAIAATGLALAVVGVVLVSREVTADAAAARANRASIGLALLAAVGFGTFFVAADPAADESVIWTLVLIRAAALPLVAGLVLVRDRARVPRGRLLVGVAGVGCIDLAATALIVAANTEGDLSIVAVLGSMYPVMTIALAWLWLRERLANVQFAGAACALAGVALVAAG